MARSSHACVRPTLGMIVWLSGDPPADGDPLCERIVVVRSDADADHDNFVALDASEESADRCSGRMAAAARRNIAKINSWPRSVGLFAICQSASSRSAC